jgi:hypothetical protein
MRGSPLLRTLAVLVALLLAAAGLFRLTAPVRPAPTVGPAAPVEPTPATAAAATFELLLSATAKSVRLDAGGPAIVRENSAEPLAGRLEFAGAAPLISLQVIWADTAPGHRFARLRLDRPGQDSIDHVFSAPGDIDDIWEP